MSDAQDGFDEEGEGGASGGIQLDLIKSYAAFGLRAVRERWVLVSTTFVIGLVLSGLVAKYIPRTYSCRTVLMAVGNPVLDGANMPNPLAGASSSIMRRENLENLVRDTGLLQKAPVRRPPLLHLKDVIIEGLFGKMTEDVQLTVLAATLESKLWVEIDQSGNLAINADWGDGKTAAEIAEGAREGFIKTRHAAEVSAFEAKMAILDEHASKMRSEVETLAQQINSAHEERAALVNKATGASAPAAAAAPAAGPVRLAAPRASTASVAAQVGAALPEMKEKLSEMKRKLIELDADRERRIRDEQAKLAELKLHLTPLHPQVVTQQERVAMASQQSSEASLLRSEIADLEANVRQREALVAHAASGTGSSFGGVASPATAGGSAPALPQEIVRALENDNTDPALSAQLSGAVMRYGQLRDEIRAGRMQLDTAQAAFDHRYQIVVPADVPNKPSKPKPVMIFFGGFALSLLLSVLWPILAQLKRGVMIERWQVHHIQLPVLAELRLPPHSMD